MFCKSLYFKPFSMAQYALIKIYGQENPLPTYKTLWVSPFSPFLAIKPYRFGWVLKIRGQTIIRFSKNFKTGYNLRFYFYLSGYFIHNLLCIKIYGLLGKRSA